MTFVFVEKAKRTWSGSSSRPPHEAYLIADKHLRNFANAYLVNIDTMLSDQQIRRLVNAVQRRSISDAMQIVPVYNPNDPDAAAHWSDMADRFEENYQRVMREASRVELADMGISTQFALDNPHSLQWLSRARDELVQRLSHQAAINLGRIVQSGFLEGFGPRRMADMIRAMKPVVGLTEREAAATRRRYQAAIAHDIAPERAQSIMARYANKLLDDRAVRIARTETIAAEAQGQADAWDVAQRAGVLGPNQMREWIASPGSDRTCPICRELHGQRVQLHEPFVSHYLGGQRIDNPPAHPHCRCTHALVIDGAPSGAYA